MSLLRVENLGKSFGGLHVTNDVSLSLQAGERLALIGPNGAGKTTLVNQISGFLTSDRGHIYLNGRDITLWPSYRRVNSGLVRTFQITKLAPEIPVIDQISLAIHQREGTVGNMWRDKRSFTPVTDEALHLLDGLQLTRVSREIPANMAYGDQRLVEVALALALRPKVLLLDEPMAGVPKSEGQLVLNALERLPSDLGVVIIEHDMDLVFRFAHRILVLANGAVLAQGTPKEIRENEVVRAVYLGKGVQ